MLHSLVRGDVNDGRAEFSARSSLRLCTIAARSYLPSVTLLARSFSPDAQWAEPDLHAAAGAMRHLFDDRDAARALGLAGRASLMAEHPSDAAAAWLNEQDAALTGSEALT